MSTNIDSCITQARQVRPCLVSYIRPKVRPFTSIFPCKRSNKREYIDQNAIDLRPVGPLIVTCKNSRAVKTIPKKESIDYFSQSNYFENKGNYKEMEHCWKDQIKPKIIRHLARNRRPSLPKKSEHKLISELISDKIREDNFFKTYKKTKVY